jgi:hypothetical protein
MKSRYTLLNKIGGLGVAVFASRWMGTLDYQAAFYDVTADPAHPDFSGPVIFLSWHEYIPIPFYLRGHCNIALLLSMHEDAELLSCAARYMGFQTVRGSTGRGGTTALRELIRKGNRMNLAITPDGPRGPRRRLAPGSIYLSSRLGVPLVAVGYGYDRPWRFNTWDRFALPRPHSRARIVTGPLMQIPPDLDRQGVEHYRHQVETLLNYLTHEAETWAENGTRKTDQRALFRQAAPRRQITIASNETTDRLRVVDRRGAIHESRIA